MTTAKKIHTNLAATACLNLPPSGTVMWGRIKYSNGKALRVDGYTDEGMAIVSHYGGPTRDLLPATLIHAYREANESDPFMVWPEPPRDASGHMDGKAATVKDGKPRKSATNRKRRHKATECDAPTVLATPSTEAATPPSPQPPASRPMSPSPVMAQPSNDAPEPPGLATTSAPARIPHFGPEPLPSAAHKVMELEDGKTVRVYLSNRDGSAWGVVRDLAKVLRMDDDKIAKRAADLDGERLVKVDVRSGYKNRVLPTRLVRLDTMGSWLHPAKDEDALIKTRREQADKFAKPDAAEEQAAPPVPEQPADDEADGDVPDGVAIVRVDGVSLVAPGAGDPDHKIRDVDLARFIGVEPRFLRRRVKDYENKGDLNGLDVRDCDARTQMPTGGVRITKVKSYFLTMDQALFVVAKSDSPSANSLTRHIISVFLKVQRQGGAVAAPVPAVDQMMATMAQIAARAASEAARETVGAMLAEFRKGQPAAAPVDEKVQQDAETLRQQRANAARKGAETRDFNEMFRNVRDVLAPLAHRFATERLVRADTRNHAELGRCLRPSEMRTMFEAFIKTNDKRIPTDEREALDTLDSVFGTGFRDRAFYCLFNEMSANVKVQRTIDEDGEQVTVSALPWYPKVALAADPRQTKIPGTGH